jgi:hypothetical protein
MSYVFRLNSNPWFLKRAMGNNVNLTFGFLLFFLPSKNATVIRHTFWLEDSVSCKFYFSNSHQTNSEKEHHFYKIALL